VAPRLIVLVFLITHLGYALAVPFAAHGQAREHPGWHSPAPDPGGHPTHATGCDHSCHAAAHLIALPGLDPPWPVGSTGIAAGSQAISFRSTRFPPPTRPPKYLA
jgi:hypothetical protein